MNNALYIAMSGAKASMDRLSHINNNIANANTTGFRAEMASTKAMYLEGSQTSKPTKSAPDGAQQPTGAGFNTAAGAQANPLTQGAPAYDQNATQQSINGNPIVGDARLNTSVFVQESTAGFNTSAGAIQSTGNPLDSAIQGEGWFVVQDASGKEAMTRAGDFGLDATGKLITASGRAVMGDGGPIEIPQGVSSLSIGKDGKISGLQGKNKVEIGTLKLVNPDSKTITRGPDGLFRTSAAMTQDENVRVISGAVESSNVSVVEEMAKMIETQRRLEMQMKIFTSLEQQGAKSSQILNLN